MREIAYEFAVVVRGKAATAIVKISKLEIAMNDDLDCLFGAKVRYALIDIDRRSANSGHPTPT